MLRRFVRSTAGAICCHLLGLGMVAGAVAGLAAELPDGDRELRAYQSATRCPSAPSELTEPADCLWTYPFIVDEVDASPRGRGNPPYAILRGPDGDNRKATFANSDPVLETLSRGDRVTGTMWRGTLTEIEAGGASQTTAEAPADMVARIAVLAMILIPSGLVLMAASAWRLATRRAHPDLTPGQRATFALSLWFLMTALLAPLPASLLPYDGEAQHALLTAAIWLPVAVIMIIVARVRTVRAGRRRAQVGMPDHEPSS